MAKLYNKARVAIVAVVRSGAAAQVSRWTGSSLRVFCSAALAAAEPLVMTLDEKIALFFKEPTENETGMEHSVLHMARREIQDVSLARSLGKTMSSLNRKKRSTGYLQP
jgi:hypothetical protein